jgi:hypothetical protein
VRISSAMRGVVQRSVAYPAASGPASSPLTRRRCCAAVSFGGRPGEACTVNPAAPCSATASRQRMTELGAHPMRRATSCKETSCCNKASARRRRASNTFAPPVGRIRHHPMRTVAIYCIIYAGVNNLRLRLRVAATTNVVVAEDAATTPMKRHCVARCLFVFRWRACWAVRESSGLTIGVDTKEHAIDSDGPPSDARRIVFDAPNGHLVDAETFRYAFARPSTRDPFAFHR